MDLPFLAHDWHSDTKHYNGFASQYLNGAAVSSALYSNARCASPDSLGSDPLLTNAATAASLQTDRCDLCFEPIVSDAAGGGCRTCAQQVHVLCIKCTTHLYNQSTRGCPLCAQRQPAAAAIASFGSNQPTSVHSQVPQSQSQQQSAFFSSTPTSSVSTALSSSTLSQPEHELQVDTSTLIGSLFNDEQQGSSSHAALNPLLGSLTDIFSGNTTGLHDWPDWSSSSAGKFASGSSAQPPPQPLFPRASAGLKWSQPSPTPQQPAARSMLTPGWLQSACRHKSYLILSGKPDAVPSGRSSVALVRPQMFTQPPPPPAAAAAQGGELSGASTPCLTPVPFSPPLVQCGSCTTGQTATHRCVECTDPLCSDCVRAHQRVRLTRSHVLVAYNNTAAPGPSTSSSSYVSPFWQSDSGNVPMPVPLRAPVPLPGLRAAQSADDREPKPSKSSDKHRSPPVTLRAITQQQTAASLTTAGSQQQQQDKHAAAGASASSNRCGLHGGEELIGVDCMTCHAMPLCLSCLFAHDKTHRIQASPSVDVRELTERLSAELKEQLKQLEEGAEAVDRMGERVEARMLSIANQVRALLHSYMSALEERKRDLLQRVDIVRQAKTSSLDAQRSHIRAKLHILQTALEQNATAAGTAGGGTADPTTKAHAALTNLIKSAQQADLGRVAVAPVETDQVEFRVPNNELLASLRNLGDLSTLASAARTCVLGEAYKRAMRGRPVNIVVQAKDHVGDVISVGGDKLTAELTSPGKHCPLPLPVADRNNGTYTLTVTPEQDGVYQLMIKVRGWPIQGAPLQMNVRRGRDYTTIGTHPLFTFGGEGKGDGQLCRPWGICIDRQGRVIVADRSNNRIQIFHRDGRFLLKFGTGGAKPGQFDRPAGVAVNSKNNIIVCDKDNHRVQAFTDNGTYVFKFGDKGRGVGQFNYPWDVAVNSEDHMAVSDTRNHRIQLFTPTGQFVRKFGFDNSIFYKHLDTPRGLSFMSDGQLLCSDFNNHRLVLLSTTTNTGTDNMKFIGREGDRQEWLGAFHRPQGIDIDPEGHILVTDSRNDRIQVFSPDLQPLCAFGRPAGDDNASLLDRPCDVAVASDGRVYVVDLGHHCVHVY